MFLFLLLCLVFPNSYFPSKLRPWCHQHQAQGRALIGQRCALDHPSEPRRPNVESGKSLPEDFHFCTYCPAIALALMDFANICKMNNSTFETWVNQNHEKALYIFVLYQFAILPRLAIDRLQAATSLRPHPAKMVPQSAHCGDLFHSEQCVRIP